MKTVDGWHCPDLLSGPGKYRNRAVATVPFFESCPRKRTAVQAGGHIGTYPRQIVDCGFQRVFTFEPDVENFACLALNTQPPIVPIRAFLGFDVGDFRFLNRSPKSTGQHRVGERAAAGADGSVPMMTIDGLDLNDCDLICLDVEGYEIAALSGTVETLRRCHPVVIAEENKRCLEFGRRIGDLTEFLASFGYRQTATVDDDLVFHA